MGGFFFPTQEDYDSYEGYDYSDPLGINKLKKPKEEDNFLSQLMNWADKYEYEGTHDIDPITGEVTKKSFPGILGGVVSDLFSIPKRGVDYLASKASGLDETIPAEEIATNALFPKYDSAPIANNLLKPFIEAVPGGALVTAHDNLSKLKKSDFKPISDAAEVGENALRGATRTGAGLGLDPTIWTGLNAPGILGTLAGGYFGTEGIKGASEKLGESYSQAFDQGKPKEAIEPFIEALGLGYLGKTGLEHSGREVSRAIPEIPLPGGYTSRSNLNFESSPVREQIPNFASAMAPSSEAPKGIIDELLASAESDPLLKRRDELKDLGVLVNPTGRTPQTETLYHGSGNADWMLGDNPLFSSRKASSANLHGGPFYFTDSIPVAEGNYAVAGEGIGNSPGFSTSKVTTAKSWDLDAEVPRDIRVKGLTIAQQAIRNAQNPGQKAYFERAYKDVKNAQTGRDIETAMDDVFDRLDDASPLDRFDKSGLHIPKDALSDWQPGADTPLRQRTVLSGKDRFLRVLENDLGYDSVKHGSKLYGGKVTIPFSRKQIEIQDAQKLTPLRERSDQSLVDELKTLNPNDPSTESLRDAIKEEIYRRDENFDGSLLGVVKGRRPLLDELYSIKDAPLTPEDEALLKEPLFQSLKNPTTRVKESTTPETTDIKDWISDEAPKDIPVGEWVDKAARALGYQDLPSASRIQGEGLSEAAKFMQSQKRKYGKEWETKQTPAEGDYLRKLLSKELSGETPTEKPPTVIQNRDSEFETVDPEVAALRESISGKSPYEMVGKEKPTETSLDRHIREVVAKRPEKPPKTPEVDLEGEPTKKTNFQVTLSNGEVYTVKGTDEINAREQVQDLIDKHKSSFKITDVKPKYSKLESDLLTSANPTEAKLASKLSREQAAEEKKLRETKAKTAQEEYQAKINAKEPSGLSQFLGGVKALASSGDLGHIARQGKQGTLYLLTHSPAEVGKAFKRMTKQTFSEKEFTDFHKTLAEDPKLLRMSKDFNLDVPGLPGHLGEEAFHGGEGIESVPVVGKYVRASDRAYTSYMNSLRYSLVNDGIARLEKSGFTMDKNPEKYRQLARGINIITQRGDISSKAAQLFNTASNVFWAPRAKYSRIQQLGEIFKPGESGRLARQGLIHTMAFNAALFGLLKAKYGDDVKFNTDPKNTDFLKIRIKNTTVDPWFGLGSIARNAIQGVEGEKVSGSTGRKVPVSGSDAVGTFITNSLAPGITMLYELASGKSTIGFEKSRLEAALGIAPLAMRDIKDITEEHGIDGLLLDILAFEGEQVNTFNPVKAKAEQAKLKKERGLKGKTSKPSSKGIVDYKSLYNF